MDTQEPGAQSESDVHKAQIANTDAAAQGANPDEAANQILTKQQILMMQQILTKDQFLMIQMLLSHTRTFNSKC